MADSVLQDAPMAQPVGSEDWAALATSRSQIYGFLGAMYNRLPDDQLVRSLCGARMTSFVAGLLDNDDLPDKMRQGLASIQRFAGQTANRPVGEICADLAVERTRLLRGIERGYGPPPPYESVYSGSTEQPLVQATVAVHRAYAEAGLGLSAEVRDQPDFIGIELDFMRHLVEREAQAWRNNQRSEAITCLQKEQAFLAEHIACWVPRFCEAMLLDAKLEFYRGIARLTEGFVLDEAEKTVEHLGRLGETEVT